MFFVDWTTGQKFTKVVRASSVVHVAERAFGSEVKWSAPTSPRILEAVLIEMVMNLSAQYFPLFLESRMCFRIDRVLEREKFLVGFLILAVEVMPSARMCVWSVAGKCIRAKLQNSFSSIFIARREPNAFYFIAQ